jgi:hypothetical protein
VCSYQLMAESLAATCSRDGTDWVYLTEGEKPPRTLSVWLLLWESGGWQEEESTWGRHRNGNQSMLALIKEPSIFSVIVLGWFPQRLILEQRFECGRSCGWWFQKALLGGGQTIWCVLVSWLPHGLCPVETSGRMDRISSHLKVTNSHLSLNEASSWGLSSFPTHRLTMIPWPEKAYSVNMHG